MTSPPRTINYDALVDWDLDGNYTGPYDNVIEHVLATDTIAIAGQGRDQARGTSPPQIPTLAYALKNTDRRYSSENDGSPLTEKLRAGRPCQVRATSDTDWLLNSPDVLLDSPLYLLGGTLERAIFTGQIDALDEEPDPNRQRVRLKARGRLDRLAKTRVATQLHTDITTGQAMVNLLTAAGLSSSEYDVDSDMVANGRILSYWYGDGRDAKAQAFELWATEGYSAFIGEDDDGVIVVQGRNYRTLNARSQDVQSVFLDEATDGGLRHVGFRISPGLRDIINRPYVDIEPRAAASLAQVWSYTPVITLDGSGAATVQAKPSQPFTGAVTPVVTTDFTLSSGTVSVTLSRTSGALTEIQFSGGSAGATISDLRLRAQSYVSSGTERVETNVDVSDSITAYGEQPLQLDAWPGLAPADAVSLCDAMALAYMEPRAVVEIDVANVDVLHTYEILKLTVSDRIQVVCFHAGADLEVLIETRKHRITPTLHLLTLGCEKVVEGDWSLYDIGLYGSGLFGQ